MLQLRGAGKTGGGVQAGEAAGPGARAREPAVDKFRLPTVPETAEAAGPAA